MQVVLVDPSPVIQGAFTRLLKSQGHATQAFSSSLAALETIRADAAVDALICSAELSPISGVELCWEVRLIAGDRRPLYILFTSSNCEEKHVVEALDCGADDFISKPPRPQEFYAKLRVADRMMTLQRELIRLAVTDPLTGIYNRRAFFEQATEACQRAEQNGPLSAILFDIDHFKDINDLYGHAVGDEAIRAVAVGAQRNYPLVGRLGGDEFSVLLSGQSLAGAVAAAEALRSSFAEVQLRTEGGDARLTCSFGVSEWQPGDSPDDLMRGADLALYRAKSEGRDRVGTPPADSWLQQTPPQTKSIARSIPR
jgi:two-component system, cell cycle response regulator